MNALSRSTGAGDELCVDYSSSSMRRSGKAGYNTVYYKFNKRMPSQLVSLLLWTSGRVQAEPEGNEDTMAADGRCRVADAAIDA